MATALFALTKRELLRWFRHVHTIILTFITPIFWIGLFAKSFNPGALFNLPADLDPLIAQALAELRDRVIVAVFGTRDYYTFVATGILAVFVLFGSIFSGASLVFDRRFGFLDRLRVAPIRRETIYFSRVLAALFRSFIQFSSLFAVALVLGLRFGPGFTPMHLAIAISALIALSLALSSIFVAVAARTSSFETLMAIANLVNLPLMFTSNALFPLRQMPDWLREVAAVNPVSHAATVVRIMVISPTDVGSVVPSLTYLGLFAALALVAGSLLGRQFLD